MPFDAVFADPTLARLYDACNPLTDERLAVTTLAGDAPINVLDLGCGTGRVALAFAELGHEVVGVDPARAMLQLARARDPHHHVCWIEADARSFDLVERFELIVMTGNVFQVFLTDDDAHVVLANAGRHLVPGGRLTFETRDPDAREWEEWTPDRTREIVRVDGVGDVEVSYAFREQRGELLTFETRHVLPDGTRFETPSTLRFRTKEQVGTLLAAAGFDEIEWWSDWRGTPWSAGTLEIVPVARARADR